MPKKIIELLVSGRGQAGSHNIFEVCWMASMCLMWCIWRERNAISFEDCMSSVVELKSVISNPFIYDCTPKV
jgi:hypothetical protein